MNRLLISWFRVVVFWWMLLTIWWSSHDRMIETAFAKVTGKPLHITALNALPSLVGVLSGWTLPMLVLTGVAFIGGQLLALGFYGLRARKQALTIRPEKSWRSVNVSLGELERPEWVPPAINDISIDGLELPPVHDRLIKEVLGYIAANPGAPVGEGHDGTLFDHTVNVILELPDFDDPLLYVAAAGHDAGKTLAWQKKGQKWIRVGNHDDFSAMIVTQMPSYSELSPEDQRVLFTILKYNHKWSRRPIVDDERVEKRMNKLNAIMSGADHSATQEEKKRVLARVEDRPTMLFNLFLEVLSTSQLQQSGMAKGARSVGMRRNGDVFLFEGEFRKNMLDNLDENIRAAYSSEDRKGNQGLLTPFTYDLLNVLDAKGWLVKEQDGKVAKPALWDIMSGTHRFNGIIHIRVPKDQRDRLPYNSPYEITVIGPYADNLPSPPQPKKPERELTEGKEHSEKTVEERRNTMVMAQLASWGAGSIRKTRVRKQQPIGVGGVTGSGKSGGSPDMDAKLAKAKKQGGPASSKEGGAAPEPKSEPDNIPNLAQYRRNKAGEGGQELSDPFT